jgi:hypothetical protein
MFIFKNFKNMLHGARPSKDFAPDRDGPLLEREGKNEPKPQLSVPSPLTPRLQTLAPRRCEHPKQPETIPSAVGGRFGSAPSSPLADQASKKEVKSKIISPSSYILLF